MIVLKIILWCLLGIVCAYIAFVLICYLIMFITGLFVDMKKDYPAESQWARFWLNFSIPNACFVCRIRLHVSGLEKLPEGPVLIVSNHLSNWDPLLTWYVFRRYHPAYVSKPANFKIPFYGRLIHRCRFLAIDRENPRNAVRTINAAADILKEGRQSIYIYPEGTRNKTQETELLPFHPGAFKIATKTNVPVVNVCLHNTNKIAKNYPWRKTDVYISVIDVIPPEYVAEHKTADISERVQVQLTESIRSFKAKGL